MKEKKKAKAAAAAAAAAAEDTGESESEGEGESEADDTAEVGGEKVGEQYVGPIRVTRCRVQVSETQHAKLLKWTHVLRATYNKMVEFVNKQASLLCVLCSFVWGCGFLTASTTLFQECGLHFP